MLDPRIYRTGLIVVALAVIVLAFSLQGQPGPVTTTLAPDAFNGQSAFASMTSLASEYPERRPGSAGDDALATEVANDFQSDGYTVSTDTFAARTADGSRTLENVVAVRPGLTTGSIVVIAHRDALSAPAIAELSGTATLLELAHDLAGQTLHRSVVLASTSGSAGTAGAMRLAATLSGPIDAVLVLGDLASTHIHGPFVVPWSYGQDVAPPTLRNTLSAALVAQTGMRAGGTSVAGQFAHLALPLTVAEQGPFGAHGVPAVLVSLSGERGPDPNLPIDSAAPITGMGRTVLEAVSALDTGPTVPQPAAYILLAGKVVPGWAMRLFVLALILPVLGATLDGLARARRRGHVLWRWIAWVLLKAAPFVLAVLVVLGARLLGAIGVAPPAPVTAGAVPLHAAGFAVLLLAAGAIVLTACALRTPAESLARRAGSRRDRSRTGGAGSSAGDAAAWPSAGAGAAVLVVLCCATLLIWLANPFAAAFLVPALHLWIWVVNPDLQLRPGVVLALLIAGLAPPLLLVTYYAVTLGFDPVGVAWSGVLLLAGGYVSVASALEWAIILGGTASVLVIALRSLREGQPEQVPITVRGPINYAGPGSLGGTKSALRR